VKQRNQLIILITDLHPVISAPDATMLLICNSDQQVPPPHGPQKLYIATARNGDFVIPVAGERKCGIGQCEDNPAVTDIETIHHIVAHEHGRNRSACLGYFDLNTEHLRRFVICIHFLGALNGAL
jgi:hypothetical protein